MKIINTRVLVGDLISRGEYIKKADMERILYSTNNAVRIGEEFLELPTYSFPDSADDNTMEWISAKVGKLFPSNDYKCSKCGNILNFDGVNCGRGDANFCPNCGRKAVNK